MGIELHIIRSVFDKERIQVVLIKGLVDAEDPASEIIRHKRDTHIRIETTPKTVVDIGENTFLIDIHEFFVLFINPVDDPALGHHLKNRATVRKVNK